MRERIQDWLATTGCCRDDELYRAYHGQSNAFDTGHHADLTRSAMRTYGFNNHAIKMAQLENWMVDYYSTQPLVGLKGDLAKLHFDSLGNSPRIAVYWQRFSANTKRAVESAARTNDPKKVVAIMGMSLHALQDFYTHSNWVENHQVSDKFLLTDSYFDNPAVAGMPTLRTGMYPNSKPIAAGDHGLGTPESAGMNHDSYARARWLQAYVFAFCASRQWIEAIRQWVVDQPNGITVWENARALSLTQAEHRMLEHDLEAAYRISEYAPGGHWKGPGSESPAKFASAVTQFAAFPDSIYVGHFKGKKWHLELTDGLELTNPPDSAPAMPIIAHPFYAVVVKTIQVEELPPQQLKNNIELVGKPDFYARVTIDGQTYLESMQKDKTMLSPTWMSVGFVSADQSDVALRYELWDEDRGLRGRDDRCDVSLTQGDSGINLSVNLASQFVQGDFIGMFDTPANAIDSSGTPPDKDCARVRVVVSSMLLNP